MKLAAVFASGFAAVVCCWGGAGAARGQAIPEGVYPPPEPTALDDPRTPPSGFRFGLGVSYLTDYVWRGIERFDDGSEDRANIQYDARIGFDLGKLPKPYVRLFVNTAEEDPISSFQEVRPEVGFDWDVRPLTISAGYTTYIFPDREGLDTSEVFARLAFDDSLLFRTERPVLNPYVFAAYDFDEFEGLYVEAGVRHVLPIEDTGLSFIADGHVAYVNGHELFSADGVEDSGFQHWQVGLTAKYTLNRPLSIPDRFGQISLLGFLNYTDSIDEDLAATSQLWGGVGISLEF